MKPSPLSTGQSIPDPVEQTGTIATDFTNVTALSWPGADVHPKFRAYADHVRLRAALQIELGSWSYEMLARLSWAVGEVAG
jgi:hypothetical protein